MAEAQSSLDLSLEFCSKISFLVFLKLRTVFIFVFKMSILHKVFVMQDGSLLLHSIFPTPSADDTQTCYMGVIFSPTACHKQPDTQIVFVTEPHPHMFFWFVRGGDCQSKHPCIHSR